MLEFHDTSDDVLAITVTDKVTSSDVEAVIDRMEAALAAHDKVHVFAEILSIDGLELSGLGGHIARAMPMMGQLRQFGRVAVVADQAWVRAMARVESAVLPFVGYRVVKPGEREAVLGWVLHG